jgi:two-component system chemotaxis response regulator CheB
LLVVHIDEAFGKSFADWLDGQSSLRARLAVDGEPVPSRDLVMAPPDHHMVVRDGQLRLSREPARHSCRPSVDTLFDSLALLGSRVAACLLTGMGRDGAEGLLAIRRAGGVTIAQDEATSIVFGMPREAIALGAALHVLPLERIAPTLTTLAQASRSRS